LRNAGADALGIAGGDGSLAAGASVAIERNLPFVVVPFGTRNHFARDIGLDRDDPIAALGAFEGHEERVDVGRVGDRLFLNNVSFGIYAELVHRREHHRRRRAALARARAAWRTLLQRRPLRLCVDGAPVEAEVVLVANNAYELDLFNVGERSSVTEGRLHLYAAPGWLPRSWEDRAAERFTIDAEQGEVEAGIDGEPERLETPLEFSSEPRALRVLLPGSPG
jgi:diacylglycerol kinase family enzyme